MEAGQEQLSAASHLLKTRSNGNRRFVLHHTSSFHPPCPFISKFSFVFSDHENAKHIMPLTPMITSTTTTTSSRTVRLEDWKTALIAVCGALGVGLLGLAALWIKKYWDPKCPQSQMPKNMLLIHLFGLIDQSRCE